MYLKSWTMVLIVVVMIVCGAFADEILKPVHSYTKNGMTAFASEGFVKTFRSGDTKLCDQTLSMFVEMLQATGTLYYDTVMFDVDYNIGEASAVMKINFYGKIKVIRDVNGTVTGGMNTKLLNGSGDQKEMLMLCGGTSWLNIVKNVFFADKGARDILTICDMSDYCYKYSDEALNHYIKKGKSEKDAAEIVNKYRQLYDSYKMYIEFGLFDDNWVIKYRVNIMEQFTEKFRESMNR